MNKIKLTREEAVAWHRKMWNEIADRLERQSTTSISDMKSEFTSKHGFWIRHNCFLCQYASDQAELDGNIWMCNYCPLTWGNESTIYSYNCENGLGGAYIPGSWLYCKHLANKGSYKEAAEEARKIANLPDYGGYTKW